ncbi:MAG: FAD-dependent oxidoreductase [Desulfobacteraceae bacterium]|nr:MAG: FAD-dependent oxidoreductase [Desulfobacteraceae bacterium]
MKHPKNRLHSVLIIGATPAGVAAANKLGEMGVPITLVDNEADLNRKLAAEKYRLDSGVSLNFAHRPGLIRILRNPHIRCAMPAMVRSIKHSPQGFRARIEMQPTYVDAQRCTLCGQCAAACPLEHDHRPIALNGRTALPGRAFIDKRRQPLCQANCPLGVNVQGYMALVKSGHYAQALDLIRMDNVLPGVCGRICTHPCEAACRRAEKDAPLAIRDTKRFIADRAGAERGTRPKAEIPPRAERIAVVGAGPAGLAAAVDLARAGYRVTLLEKEKAPGGLLRYGIGAHRLPRDILDAEVALLQVEEGVEIVCGQAVSLPQGLLELRKTCRAVILTTGSWADRRLGVPGEDLKGVQGCISFLSRYYRGEAAAPGGQVAVIGDGNAAFDLARVLNRTGAAVSVVSWFAAHEIPADRDEVEAAKAEGVTILERRQVVGFHGLNGELQALRLQATRPGPADARGICWPEIVPGSPIVEAPFDYAFVAVGQAGAYNILPAEEGLKITVKGLLDVDGAGRTSLEGIYAAGDAAGGATSVVHAMAEGRRVARQVIKDLGGVTAAKADLNPTALRPADRDFDPIAADLPPQARVAMPELALAQRRGNFAEVALGFTETQAAAEAGRCLQCGRCAHCLACVPACAGNNAIRHNDRTETHVENAGVLIVADPRMAPRINGDDVIRAYGPPGAKTDVNAMMLRGYSAAAKTMVLLQRNGLRLIGQGMAFVPPDPGLSRDLRIGVFACRCNDSFGWSPALDAFMQDLKEQPDIVHAQVLPSACLGEGIQQIVDSVRDKGLTRLVLASCVCCPLNFVCSACTDQRSRLKRGLFDGTGISRSMVQTCNLRGEVLRLIEKDASQAVRLFKGIITRSIGRARKLLPFPAPARAYNFTTAVIGQTEAARSAALTLAQAGYEVLMFGSAKNPLLEAPAHAGIFALDGSSVDAVSGTLGNFQIHARCADGARTFCVGGVILGEKSRNIAIYRQHDELPQVKVQAQMQKKLAEGIPFMYPCTTSISGLFLADPPGIQISKRTKGEAAAVLAAAAMPRGPRQSRGFSVVVNEDLCRGCGRCMNACVYQAVSLKKGPDGAVTAVVDDALCKGCGNCISVCPSNAADSPFRDQIYLEQTLEELLMAGSRS